jgi:hypothetical protein
MGTGEMYPAEDVYFEQALPGIVCLIEEAYGFVDAEVINKDYPLPETVERSLRRRRRCRCRQQGFPASRTARWHGCRLAASTLARVRPLIITVTPSRARVVAISLPVVGLAYPQLTIFQFRLKQLAFILSSSFNVKILVALPHGEGSGPWEEFMAEDFCDEDVLGHVYGFKAVAADSGVGAWFPGKGEGAEGGSLPVRRIPSQSAGTQSLRILLSPLICWPMPCTQTITLLLMRFVIPKLPQKRLANERLAKSGPFKAVFIEQVLPPTTGAGGYHGSIFCH